ncbi:response regulator [Roseisolibacter agri]|uniref:DNA-binding response regulator n=1 Tax=Roseisolibacter agri TaxID=2014610 RepID=A0AA37PZQ6_9BACT|nr:response regulator transcription factor [Roseisolibacter agri]GLC23794.1 DNA-binding response regulator [Roseisolibacter agri]
MSPATAAHASPSVIRILIADDHAIVRDGLRALVAAQPGLEVVGEAADGREAHRRACDLKPDVLLLDLSMPGASGTDAAERIAHDCPTVRVIALTMHEERGYVARLLRAGAAGYVLKRTPSDELVRAIRVVAAGGTYVDPSLAGALLAEPPSRAARAASAPRAAGAAELTPREAEVLRLVARGHSNKEIAAALDVSVKTVESHKANGMAKLGLTARAALVRFALDEGWMRDA